MEIIEPFLTPEIEPVKAKFKAWAEDFIVEEVPLYPPLGSGNHLYLWIEKTRLTTPEVAQALSEMAGAKLRDIGYAGLKDKQAVTRQWFSVPAECEAKLSRFKREGAVILETTRHRNKLRVGHLRGNRFLITLRGPGLDEAALARTRAVLDILVTQGLPNFFGPQRFSSRDPNHERARSLLARVRPDSKLHWDDKFSLNSLQSGVFNAVLAARIRANLYGVMLAGDLALTVPFGGLFSVEDVAEVQARREQLLAVPSGPLPGPEMRQPTGAALEFERAAIAASDYGALDFSHSPAPGERRPLAVALENAEVKPEGEALRLSFELPAGSYATNVIREIMKAEV